MSKQDLSALLREARITNAQRDAGDREFGFAAPGDGNVGMLAATIAEAIRAGLLMGDWTCIAEGYAMLIDDLLPQLRRQATKNQ